MAKGDLAAAHKRWRKAMTARRKAKTAKKQKLADLEIHAAFDDIVKHAFDPEAKYNDDDRLAWKSIVKKRPAP